MRIPCGGPRNLLKDQYVIWWTSVFLKTITSECVNIPAFSYLGIRSSSFHPSENRASVARDNILRSA